MHFYFIYERNKTKDIINQNIKNNYNKQNYNYNKQNNNTNNNQILNNKVNNLSIFLYKFLIITIIIFLKKYNFNEIQDNRIDNFYFVR